MAGYFRTLDVAPSATRAIVEASNNPPSVFDRVIIVSTLFNAMIGYSDRVTRAFVSQNIFPSETPIRLQTIATNIIAEPKHIQHEIDGHNFLQRLKVSFGSASEFLAAPSTIPIPEREEGLHAGLSAFAFLQKVEHIGFEKPESYLDNPYKADPFVALHVAAILLNHVCRETQKIIGRPMSTYPRHEPLTDTDSYRKKIQVEIPFILKPHETLPQTLQKSCNALVVLSRSLENFIEDAQGGDDLSIPPPTLELLEILQRYISPYRCAGGKIENETDATVISFDQAVEKRRKQKPARPISYYDM